MTDKLTSGQRTGFYTAMIAAGAALLGAIIGVIGSIQSQDVAGVNAQKIELDRVKRETCANFISSAYRVDLLLNSVYTTSLAPETTLKSEYMRRLETITEEPAPSMYGQAAIVQLIMNPVVVKSGTAVLNTMAAENSYIKGRINESIGMVLPRGVIEGDHIREFADGFEVAKNAFVHECQLEIEGQKY
jgi:hypothetical protein